MVTRVYQNARNRQTLNPGAGCGIMPSVAIKFKKIKPGMILYDRRRDTMGNTRMMTIREWPVEIFTVDPVTWTAVVSWNHNYRQIYDESRLTRLYSWSMHDPGVVVKTLTTGQVVRVSRKPGKKAIRAALVADAAWSEMMPVPKSHD